MRQRVWLGSMLRAEEALETAESWEGEAARVAPADPGEAMYFVVLASKSANAIAPALPSLSLFADAGQSELARYDAQAREAIRLDGLAVERLAVLDRQTGHIQHLERLVAQYDAEVARKDALIAAEHAEGQRTLDAATEATAEAVRECDRLQRALDAQERIIAYRQSLRWWLVFPWLRMKLAWSQWRGR